MRGGTEVMRTSTQKRSSNTKVSQRHSDWYGSWYDLLLTHKKKQLITVYKYFINIIEIYLKYIQLLCEGFVNYKYLFIWIKYLKLLTFLIFLIIGVTDILRPIIFLTI